MPDPKLIAAMEEVKQVMAKHDIAGVVLLSSPTHIEYYYGLSASWNSILQVANTAIRFRCKRADYPTPEAWQEALRLGVGTIAGFAHALEEASQNLTGLLRRLGRQGVHIEHMTKDEGPRPPEDPPRM